MSEYGRAEFVAQLGVSRETAEALETHLRLLRDWSERMNLVGPKELDLYWKRHALDSAQLVALAPGAKRWVDLGSGAGFPGLVVAAMLIGDPAAEVHMVESIGKKAQFLRAAAEAMGVRAKIFHQRIEEFAGAAMGYDVVTARALAALPRILEHAKPILGRGAIGLFHKGADADAELAAAKNALNGGASGPSYRADALESLSDPRGRIIRVTKAA